MRVTSSKTLDRPHYGRPSLKGAVLLCLFACLVVGVSTVAEVDLSKLDTEDTDPKVTYPKLVAKAFPKKYKPISKKQATKFMIEHYTGVSYKDFYDEHKFTNIPIEKVHEFDYISEWIGRTWQRRGRKPFSGQDLVDLMLSNGYTKFLEEKATEMLRSSAEASEGDL